MGPLNVCLLFAFVAGTLGRSLSPADPRIIGGSAASVGQFPHQGSLQRNSGGNPDGHTCGCSLISTTWVISAAHCVGAGASGLSVVMGLHQRGNANAGSPKRYYISQIYKHSGFNPSSLVNDISVIRLSSTVTLNQYVKTITMAPTGSNFDNQYCTISGWGVTRVGGGSLATTLQYATVQAYTNTYCRNFWSIGGGHICVGVMNQKGACNGDSGGPLVCSGYLAGLTSFGTQGCYTNKPSVYTRVSYYRSWVKGITGV